MSMQDRAYAAAIFIILGLCCIGAYVAASGFMNAHPEGLSLSLNRGTESPTAGVTIEIPTETAAPPTSSPLPPTRTPEGFRPTDTPAATRPPTLDFIPTIETPEITPTEEATATPASGPACEASICPQLGPPDSRGPNGNTCPQDYIWGFVTDNSGKGMSGVRIHFREVNGAEGDARSKGAPDPEGRFDFPANAGTWSVVVWTRDGDPISPAIQVQAGQAWGGSGNCPTRVDFVQK